MIEDELGRYLDDCLKKEELSDLTRSVIAYVELRRFDRAKEAIQTDDLGKLSFWRDGHNYTTIREVVSAYCERNLSKEKACADLESSQRRAEAYLRQRDFNPDLEKEWFTRKEKEHLESMQRLDEARLVALELLKKYEK